MKLSEQLEQDHACGDFGRALAGYSDRAAALEAEIERLNAVLAGRVESDRERRGDVLRMRKRLCEHEGHLAIHDSDGRAWCELCECEVLPVCPECGAATWVDTQTPCGDHPELATSCDACTVCDWTGAERPPDT